MGKPRAPWTNGLVQRDSVEALQHEESWRFRGSLRVANEFHWVYISSGFLMSAKINSLTPTVPPASAAFDGAGFDGAGFDHAGFDHIGPASEDSGRSGKGKLMCRYELKVTVGGFSGRSEWKVRSERVRGRFE
jgi:hypothetical protein